MFVLKLLTINKNEYFLRIIIITDKICLLVNINLKINCQRIVFHYFVVDDLSFKINEIYYYYILLYYYLNILIVAAFDVNKKNN
jgi:hypothetical protein